MYKILTIQDVITRYKWNKSDIRTIPSLDKRKNLEPGQRVIAYFEENTRVLGIVIKITERSVSRYKGRVQGDGYSLLPSIKHRSMVEFRPCNIITIYL